MSLNFHNPCMHCKLPKLGYSLSLVSDITCNLFPYLWAVTAALWDGVRRMDSGECGKMKTLAPPLTKSENLGKYLAFLFQNMPKFKV